MKDPRSLHRDEGRGATRTCRPQSTPCRVSASASTFMERPLVTAGFPGGVLTPAFSPASCEIHSRRLRPIPIRSRLPTQPAAKIREIQRGLPTATGYRVTVKALRDRTAPHLRAFTYWGEPGIVIQVPEPFRPFHELVDLGALGTPN